jgi:hypothetical protein
VIESAPRRARQWNVFFVGVLAVLAVLAGACLILFLLPRRTFLDIFVFTDGQRERLAMPGRAVQALRAAMAAGALLWTALAGVLVIQRRRVRHAFEVFVDDLSRARDRFRSDWRAWRDEAGTRGLAILLLAIGVGIGLRLSMLHLSMGQDESITVEYFAIRTLVDVISDYVIPNNHIFHTLLVHLNTQLFGVTEASVRAPALLAGILVIPASFWLAYRLFGSTTALLTAVLTASAPMLVEYSGAARGYSLLTLFVVLAFIAATFEREKPSLTSAVAFVAASALGFYTVTTMLFSFAAIVLFLLLSHGSTGSLWRTVRRLAVLCAAVGVSVGLLYLPVLARCSLRTECSDRYYAPLDWPQLARRGSVAWSNTLSAWLGGIPTALGVGVLVSGLLAATVIGTGRGTARRVVGSFFVAIALLLVIQHVAPPARTWSFLLPILLMVASYGMVQLGQRVGRTAGVFAAVGVLAAGATYWTGRQIVNPTLGRMADAPGVPDENRYRDIGLYLAKNLGPGDVAVIPTFKGPSWPARFYLLKAGVSICAIHEYEPHKPFSQLAPYPTMLVVVPHQEGRPPADEIAAELGVSRDVIDGAFSDPKVQVQFEQFVGYRVDRKAAVPPNVPRICGIATPFG